MKNKFILSIIACLLFCIAGVQKSFSHLKGDRLLGGIGLDAGSQAPAQTFSLLVPVYFYDASSLKNANGNKIAEPNFNMFLTGVGGSYVSGLKILGANYGASLLVPFAQNRIQGNNVDSKSSFAFSDLYLQPFQLGWKTKVADFVLNYGMYIPTGKYQYGGDSNAGLGMFTNEFQTGTTLRLDPKGSIAFSSLFSYEIHNDKKGTDIKPGDIFTIEGGLGKTWYTFNGTKIPSSIIKTGIVYYMQFKATNDELPAPAIISPYANSIYLPGKDHVYSLGLEGNILLTKSRMLLGLRWFDEFSAVNRFQGNTFFVTIAHVFSTAPRKAE